MDGDRGFGIQQKNEDAEAQYSMHPYYKSSRRTLSPLASPVPTMKSAEFSVDGLRECSGLLSDSGRW